LRREKKSVWTSGAPEPRLGLVGSANNQPEPSLVNRLISIYLSLPRLHDKGSGGGGQVWRWRAGVIDRKGQAEADVRWRQARALRPRQVRVE